MIKSERNIRLSVVTLRVSLKQTLRRRRQLSFYGWVVDMEGHPVSDFTLAVQPIDLVDGEMWQTPTPSAATSPTDTACSRGCPDAATGPADAEPNRGVGGESYQWTRL